MAKKGVGYTKIATVTVSTGLGAVPTGANSCVVQAAAQAVRWRADGTAPTATDGMTLAVGASQEFVAGDFSKVLFIEIVVGAILHVHWFKN